MYDYLHWSQHVDKFVFYHTDYFGGICRVYPDKQKGAMTESDANLMATPSGGFNEITAPPRAPWALVGPEYRCM